MQKIKNAWKRVLKTVELSSMKNEVYIKMNKKKLLFLVIVIAILFCATGCSIPTDENGKFVLISLSTTFRQMIDNEGFFAAIFVYPLSQLINWLASKQINIGLAIVIVAVVINGLVLAVTMKQNIQMQRMQALQPELEKIQRKYEGKTDERSRMRQAQEMQNLYQKYDVNPFGSMITMFIQFPILIAMYQAVQRAEAVATGSFFGMSLESTPWQGFKEGQLAFVVLYILMLVAQFAAMMLPMWLNKRRAKMEAEKHHRTYRETKNPMGSTMYFMLAFIGIIGVTWPTAMSLYWMISSCVQIVKAVIVDQLMAKQKKD